MMLGKRAHAAGLRRSVPARTPVAPGGLAPRGTSGRQEPARPDDNEVWTWAQSVTLGGYGPPASSFL